MNINIEYRQGFLRLLLGNASLIHLLIYL